MMKVIGVVLAVATTALAAEESNMLRSLQDMDDNATANQYMYRETLKCETFESVAAAEAACSGNFKMWGEYALLDGTTGDAVKNGTSAAGAVNGPYSCSSCGYGYVCSAEGGGCPAVVIREGLFGYQTSSTSIRQCPDFAGKKDEITCSVIQKTCQDAGYGWLIAAESFEADIGTYSCAGCEQGYVTGRETGIDLTSWTLLAVYGLIGTIWVIASVIDFRVFMYGDVHRPKAVDVEELPDRDGNGRANTAHEWRSLYALRGLGYVDHDGVKSTCWKQTCQNRFCTCCGEKDSEGRRDPDGFANFLSVFFISLGIAALFKGGKLVPHTCFFAGAPTFDKAGDSVPSDAYPRLFGNEGFGQGDAPQGGIPQINPFTISFILNELLVVLFQFSLNLLTRAVDEAKIATRRNAMRGMVLLSGSFAAAAIAWEWNSLKSEVLFINWVAGLFVVVILLGPAAGAAAYLVGLLLVSCGCLTKPFAVVNEVAFTNDNNMRDNKVVATPNL